MELIAELPPAHAWKELNLPERLGDYLDWAKGAGAKGLLWPSDQSQAHALREALRGRDLPVTVVLPNMPLYARDAMDAGPTGAVLKRLRRLSPLAFVKLGLRLLPRVPALLEKRFAAGIMLLVDSEHLAGGPRPARAALHPSAFDLAMALGAPELTAEFRDWGRARGIDAVFLTSNPGRWEVSGILGAGVLPWTDFAPSSPDGRLRAWKARADRDFL